MKRWTPFFLRLLKNFYFLVGLAFLIWVFFIDSNDLFTQLRLLRTLNKLRSEKAAYERRLEAVSAQHHQLLYDTALLERVAREKYGVKRKGEDVYIIRESKKKQP